MPVATMAGTLVAAAVIVYHNALSAYFFDDDFQWLVGSWAFRPAQFAAFGTLSHFYRPLIDLYFATATPLFRGSPVMFHLANVTLHAANGLMVFALARQISRSSLYGFLAALFFVVQPSDIDAIAWVGALGEPLGGFFGCLSLLFFLKWSFQKTASWRTLSVIAFLLALLAHESSVVFLPVIALADWAFAHQARKGAPGWRGIVATYAPYILLTLIYLVGDVIVNGRNYVVGEGHYTVGTHVVTNTLDYVDALYVGRRDPLNYAAILFGIAALLLKGSRRVRFATGWMLLSLGPFVFFNWGNTSRYLYQPAIGFSLLLADGILQLDPLLTRRVPLRGRVAILALIVGAVTIRFATFAMANVKSFADRTEVYRHFVTEFRAIHGDVPGYTVLGLDPRLKIDRPYRFVNAAVQWEYRDPTIQLETYDAGP